MIPWSPPRPSSFLPWTNHTTSRRDPCLGGCLSTPTIHKLLCQILYRTKWKGVKWRRGRRESWPCCLWEDFKSLRSQRWSLSRWKPRNHPRSNETPFLEESPSPHHLGSRDEDTERCNTTSLKMTSSTWQLAGRVFLEIWQKETPRTTSSSNKLFLHNMRRKKLYLLLHDNKSVLYFPIDKGKWRVKLFKYQSVNSRH